MPSEPGNVRFLVRCLGKLLTHLRHWGGALQLRMRHLRPTFTLVSLLFSGCSTADPGSAPFIAQPLSPSFASAKEPLDAALAQVCRPYLAGDPSKVRASALCTASGFRMASPTEALEGIGEDYVAVISPTAGSRVTLNFNLNNGGRDCGIAVMGAPQAFDSFLENLISSGWKSARPSISGNGELTEWLWAPDESLTVVAARLRDISAAGKDRVLALYVTKGAHQIPPVCSPTQAPPCQMTY